MKSPVSEDCSSKPRLCDLGKLHDYSTPQAPYRLNGDNPQRVVGKTELVHTKTMLRTNQGLDKLLAYLKKNHQPSRAGLRQCENTADGRTRTETHSTASRSITLPLIWQTFRTRKWELIRLGWGQLLHFPLHTIPS